METLTQEEFDRLADQTRMGRKSRELAKAYLVDGEHTYATLAEKHGCSRQNVSKACRRILQQKRLEDGDGEGDWVRFVAVVPRPVRDRLQEIVTAFRKARLGL